MQKALTSTLLAGFLIAPVPCLVACGGGSAVSRTIDDATITTRVKTSLLNEPEVAAQRITVQTTGGVVTLSGSVKSADEEQRAIGAARKVDGVRDVKSQLKIEGGQFLPSFGDDVAGGNAERLEGGLDLRDHR